MDETDEIVTKTRKQIADVSELVLKVFEDCDSHGESHIKEQVDEIQRRYKSIIAQLLWKRSQ